MFIRISMDPNKHDSIQGERKEDQGGIEPLQNCFQHSQGAEGEVVACVVSYDW